MNKQEIINDYGKLEFEEFVKNNNLYDFFDEEGIKALYESPRREERIDYILAFCPKLNELFKNDLFVEVLLSSRFSHFCININNLDYDCVQILMKKMNEKNCSYEEISNKFGYFKEAIKEEMIRSRTLPMDLIYCIFENGRLPDKVAILETYDIDLTREEINIYELFYNAKHSFIQQARNNNFGFKNHKPLSIPSHLITKELAEKIWDKYDIYSLRNIINMAEYAVNSDVIKNYVKYKEEEMIILGTSGKYLPPLDKLYENVLNIFETQDIIENDNMSGKEYDDIWRKYGNNRSALYHSEYFKHKKKLFYNIKELIENKDINSITQLFENENHKMLSNYIIDYHFEENYHNIKLDVDELLDFYFRGNINLPEEFINIYQKVSNIDYLSIEEKYELHEELKQYNMIERFYDDMSFARRIVRETIKDYSLTQEALEQFLDEKMTEEYGVPVYNVQDHPFFGIVKSGSHRLDNLPTGHSFSLVGNNCVSVFGRPEDSNTYLYDAETLNPDQIVHVYPRDSFTIYRPFDSVPDGTDRVNTLLTAPELISASTSYNELLILEQGKEPHEIDKEVQALKRIALYCVDKISKKDIIEAKKEGVGIIIVSAKGYNHDLETTERLSNPDYSWDYNYFNSLSDTEKFEERRM